MKKEFSQKIKLLLPIAMLLLASCKSENVSSTETTKEPNPAVEPLNFNSKLWQQKEDEKYVYRAYMYNSVLYNDSIRALDKSGVLNALGLPDRENDNHLYYEISRKRLGEMTLNAKFLVIKINEKDLVEWIKVHGD